MSRRILIADDELSVRQLLELVFLDEGYEVSTVQNGDELVRTAQKIVPDLLLIDLMMPTMDGYEAIRQLRNDTRTAHLPMIIITAKSTPNDIVVGFETGADDYICKPFNISELLARVKGHLRRALAQPVRNPLTGLPGNILLIEEIKYRLRDTKPFALLYIDIDHFKAFNDIYGPARGDRVIRLLANLIMSVMNEHGAEGDFIGHIGGDDFAVISAPERVDTICRVLMQQFDTHVRTLYDRSDLEIGVLKTTDRQGIMRSFPITSISVGCITNKEAIQPDHEEFVRKVADMKARAKLQSGNSYAIDGQVVSLTSQVPDLASTQIILALMSENFQRLNILATLRSAGYIVLSITNTEEIRAAMSSNRIGLVIANLKSMDEAHKLADKLIVDQVQTPLLALLSGEPEDEAPAKVQVLYGSKEADPHDILAIAQQMMGIPTP